MEPLLINQTTLGIIYGWPQNPVYKDFVDIIEGEAGNTLYLKNVIIAEKICLTTTTPSQIRQLNFVDVTTKSDVKIEIGNSSFKQIKLDFIGDSHPINIIRNSAGSDNCILVLTNLKTQKINFIAPYNYYRGHNDNLMVNCVIDEIEMHNLDCSISRSSKINCIRMHGKKKLYIRDESIVNSIEAELELVTIDKSNIKEKIKLGKDASLDINNSTITAPLEFQTESIKTITIKDSKIVGEFKLENCSIERFVAERSSFTSIKLDSKKTPLNTLFEDSEFNSNSIEELRISNLGGKLNLIGKDNFDSKISLLSINHCPTLELSVLNYLISQLQVGPTSISDSIKWNFENTNFNSISLKRIDNQGSIDFVNCNSEDHPAGELMIRYSKLGETNLLSTNFQDFQSFSIIGSNISGLNLLQSQLPDKVKEQNLRKGKKAECSRLKLVYSQLRELYAKQGYLNNALHCRANELNYYRLELLYGFNLNKFWTWVQLTLNRITNNYGTNWIQATLVTFLIFGIPTHWAYVHSFGYEATLNPDWETTKKLVGHYFKFMSPIRSFNYNHGLGTETFVTPIYDFIGRVLIAYGIYETIQAFRKHGRSSI